ncbi:MAG: hypothetical protein E3K37_17385 [Candidatus Kuenenia sp.]|nr:hypothetical protein [Candidatus Kuenenia hertensis]
MNPSDIIDSFHRLGYELFLDGGLIRYRYTSKNIPPEDQVLPLLGLLKEYKLEVIKFLEKAESEKLMERMCIQGENTEPGQTMPFIDGETLVIPFDSHERYHWWKKGGQSPCDTLKELGRCDLIDKYKHISKN